VQEQSREVDVEKAGARSWKQRRVKPLVAFSCGPYAACLADGSEYTGKYADTTTFEQLLDFHRQKLRVSSQLEPPVCVLYHGDTLVLLIHLTS
jgi:S-methylmethionine-dependent homocysteine/selenocysteine methylase